jgi:tripartite-type tricarboxylate transporter receptor subunit TctC
MDMDRKHGFGQAAWVTMTLLFLLGIAVTLLAPAAGYCAESDFPKRPLTVVVPFSAGGSTDIQARLVSNFWQKHLGQPIGVENKPGGGGAIGIREVLRARPDGHTVGCGMFPDSIIQVALKGEETGFKNEDLRLLGSFSNNPGAMMVMKDGPFKKFSDFVDYAKKNPGKLTVSISSPTWMLHLIELEDAFGIKINAIMFKGGAEQVNALLGGHVMASMGGSHFAVTGKDKGIAAVAVSGSRRLSSLPEVPTLKELGTDIAYDVRRFFFVPSTTSKPIVDKLISTLSLLENEKEFAEKVKASGEEFQPIPAREFEKTYQAMSERITSKVKKNKDRFSD